VIKRAQPLGIELARLGALVAFAVITVTVVFPMLLQLATPAR
jgi:hypothetical protein